MNVTRTRIKFSVSRYGSPHFILRHPDILIIISSLIVSIVTSSTMLLGDPNSLIYYGDAVSHLVIAKRVIDSVTPGIAQFGSIWLPMTHIMLVPFVANNFLFQTGLAGTIVSGVSTAISAVFLFRITKLHFGSNYYGYLACALFLMNTSVIYMSIVPMMEAPFMMFSLMASYYGLKWCFLYKNGNDLWLQYRNLLKCSIAITAATLTRYEAWFFPLGLLIMVLVVLLIGRKELWKRKIEAFIFIAAPYSFVGIASWIIYNGLIFKNPLLFLTGPYSAQAQSLTRPYREHLYFQPVNALSTLFSVAVDMFSLHVVLLSILGTCVFIFMKRKKYLLISLLTVLMLAFPILLDLVAMIQGSGEIYRHVTTGWFNGRYLVFVAPLFAFSCTAIVVFAASFRKKVLTVFVVLTVLSFYGISMAMHPLQIGSTTALSDGTILPYRGDTAYAIEAGKSLQKLYSGGRILDFTLSKSSPIIQLYSGIPLKNFVDTNNRDYWTESKVEPWTHVQYIIMQKPVEHLSGLHINQTQYYDPVTKVIVNWTRNFVSLTSPWQPVGDSLLSSIRIIYQNPDFIILKNEKKDLVLEKFAEHLNSPSAIAIAGNDDILVAQKKTGIINRIVNGSVIDHPVLDVNVATRGDRGLLGMAVAKNQTRDSTYVYLYFTESAAEDGDDNGYSGLLGNRLYRYELLNDKLVNPKLLLDLPSAPQGAIINGKVTVGPDNNIYVLVTDLKNSTEFEESQGSLGDTQIRAQEGKINILKNTPDKSESKLETSKIIRLTQDGEQLPASVVLENHAFANSGSNESKKIYGDQIKNVFGVDFDPITKDFWFAESQDTGDSKGPVTSILSNSSSPRQIEQILDYQSIWNKITGPMIMSFVNSTKLGMQYQNDLLIGNMNNGELYHFDLNKNRTDLVINGSVADKAPDNGNEKKPQILLTGLGNITDIQTADDGYVYFSTVAKVSKNNDNPVSSEGSIYRLKGPGK